MGLETFLHCPISYPLLGWWAFYQVRKWKKGNTAITAMFLYVVISCINAKKWRLEFCYRAAELH